MEADIQFAEEPIRRQSYLMWLFHALGVRYTFLLPLAGLIAFLVVLFLVLKGKGHTLPAALLLVVPLPVVIGVIGVLDGLIASFQVISSSGTVPKPSALVEGLSMSLVTAWVGMLLAAPAYFLAVVGMCIRSLTRDGNYEGDRPLAATLVKSKP